jgi:hypothetical protein
MSGVCSSVSHVLSTLLRACIEFVFVRDAGRVHIAASLLARGPEMCGWNFDVETGYADRSSRGIPQLLQANSEIVSLL